MINKELNTKRVHRLKECIKDSHLTQKDLAKLSNYTQQYISYITTGKRAASTEALINFSKVLNVRKEYLLCEDDYKTSEDLKKSLRVTDQQNIDCVLQYLDSLGYSLRFCYKVQIEVLMLYYCFNDIKDYVIEKDLKVLTSKYDFSLPVDDFIESSISKYGEEYETFCVDQNFPGIFEKLDSRITAARERSRSFFFDPDRESAYTCIINSTYLLFKNNEYIRSVSHKEVLRFLDILDNFAKCTIENILLNDYISPLTPEDVLIQQEAMLKKVITNNSKEYNYKLLKGISSQIPLKE